MMAFDIPTLKLSVQRALTYNVSPNLRAVCADIVNHEIVANFYYDGEISEEDKEMYNSAVDEIIADFYNLGTDEIQTEFCIPIIRLDYPEKMPLIGYWIYYRNEPNNGLNISPDTKDTLTLDIPTLKLSLLRALLGNVSPNLRAVCSDFKSNEIFVNFYYDGEISEEDREMYNSAVEEILADFFNTVVDGKKIVFHLPIIRLDYPEKMPLIGDWVYYRNEDSKLYF